MKTGFSYCIFIFCFCSVAAQNNLPAGKKNKIDSLLDVLKTAKVDTNIINTNNLLSEQHWKHGEFDKAVQFANVALKAAKEAKPDATRELIVKRGEYTALNNLGIVSYMKSDFTDALEKFKSAQKGYEEILSRTSLDEKAKKWAGKGLGAICSNIGLIYFGQGNYPESLKNHFIALRRREEIGDRNGVSISYNNIASVYYNQDNYEEALKTFRAGLKIKEEINDKNGIASAYNNIGNVYFRKNDYPEALKNFFTSLEMLQKQGDTLIPYYSNALNNIGIIYEFQGKYKDAINMHMRSLRIKEQISDKHGIENSYISLGNVFARQRKFAEAKKYLNKGLEISKEIGDKQDIKTSYTSLFQLDSASGNEKGAYENYKLAIAYRDSLVNEENTKKTVQQQMQYEFDKKESLAKAEQEKKDLKSEEDKRKQKMILWFTVFGLAIVTVVAVFIFRSLQANKRKNRIITLQKEMVEKQKHIVEEKQKEILDSIHYAKRIQTALLTSEKYITRNLNKINP